MYTYIQTSTTTRSRTGRIESTSVLWCCTINKNCQSNSDSYELMSFGFWLAVGGTLPYQIIIRSPNWNWVIIVNIIIYDRVDDSPRKNANVFSWNWVKLLCNRAIMLMNLRSVSLNVSQHYLDPPPKGAKWKEKEEPHLQKQQLHG